MKLHCHRPSLAAAFQIVSGIVPSRTPKDILKNVKLEVADGRATLIGTDQEVGIRYEIPGIETDSAGEVLLPTNRVISILRELQDDGVNLEVTEDAIWIRAGHSEFRLSSEDAAEFPPVAGFDDEKVCFIIPGRDLKEMIRRTAFASDVESTRYALGGILLDLSTENRVTLAATDSRRLAVVKSTCRTEGEGEIPNKAPVIPTKAMSLIDKSVTDEEDVQIAVHANDVLIKSASSTIYSRLVEGRFPRYNEVIPKETKVSIELVVGPFHAAVRQAQIVTDEESRGVDFNFSNGTLTLNSQAADIGQSKVEMPISYEHEDLTITFDPRFVAEFLRVLEPEKSVRLDLIDGESAAVFHTEDDYTYVIMPLSKDR